MASLREIQQSFAAAFLFGEDAGAARHVVENGIATERRIGIYRNNTRMNFRSTLEAAFPVVLRLAGPEWFRQTALAYMQEHPSSRGNLHYVGESFAVYLERLLADTPYAYFADVARLEWAYQEVLVAADADPLELSALRSVAAEDYERLVFRLHPAARVLHSRFPVLAIWKANQSDDDQCERIDLDSGAQHLLAIRRSDHVELREIAPTDHLLLSEFALQHSLADAAEALVTAYPEADLSAVLSHCAQLGALATFTLAPSVERRSGEL